MNLMISDLISLSYKSNLGNESAIIPAIASYSINEFTSFGLILKVNFSDPLYVSHSFLKDRIDLVILDSSIFKAKSDGHQLKGNYSLVGIQVPKQMASEEDYEIVSGLGSGAENGMIFTLVVPFLFMIFMSVSMNRVWALYNMLQLLINISNY